jgi:hypothetical protein
MLNYIPLTSLCVIILLYISLKDHLTGSLCQLQNVKYSLQICVTHLWIEEQIVLECTRMMTRKLTMDHFIHTYPIHALVHHDYQKFPKMSAMGKHPLQ